MSRRSIFALELCLPLDAALHAELVRTILSGSERLGLQEKWQRWQYVCQLLLQHQANWLSGCWDFWDDHDKAIADFHHWAQALLTREGARAAPSGEPGPYRAGPRYMTVTLAALIVLGSQSERALQAICNIPQPALWQRSSFARILQGLPYLSFASVEKDTLYVIPGELGWGLTGADLQQQKFEYLRPIM